MHNEQKQEFIEQKKKIVPQLSHLITSKEKLILA